MSGRPYTGGYCNEVQMTPAQCNDVIEDRLSHLEPVLKRALATMQRVEASLANGGFNWRAALLRAKKHVLEKHN